MHFTIYTQIPKYDKLGPWSPKMENFKTFLFHQKRLINVLPTSPQPFLYHVHRRRFEAYSKTVHFASDCSANYKTWYPWFLLLVTSVYIIYDVYIIYMLAVLMEVVLKLDYFQIEIYSVIFGVERQANYRFGVSSRWGVQKWY